MTIEQKDIDEALIWLENVKKANPLQLHVPDRDELLAWLLRNAPELLQNAKDKINDASRNDQGLLIRCDSLLSLIMYRENAALETLTTQTVRDMVELLNDLRRRTNELTGG